MLAWQTFHWKCKSHFTNLACQSWSEISSSECVVILRNLKPTTYMTAKNMVVKRTWFTSHFKYATTAIMTLGWCRPNYDGVLQQPTAAERSGRHLLTCMRGVWQRPWGRRSISSRGPILKSGPNDKNKEDISSTQNWVVCLSICMQAILFSACISLVTLNINLPSLLEFEILSVHGSFWLNNFDEI